MRLGILLLISACAFAQYTPPSGGGGGGGSPSGSTDSVQTRLNSSTFGNSGFANAAGAVAFGNAAALSDEYLFEYAASISDATPYGGALNNNVAITYSGPDITGMTSFGFNTTNAGDASMGYLGGVSGQAANGGAGTIDTLSALHGAVANYGSGTVTTAYGAYIDSPTNSGTITNNYAFWAGDQTGATNSYYSWFDSQGVRRVKEDTTFDSVGQAIEALYNPQFAKYTPGASNYERVVLGQWNGNVAEIGAEKGGTGTLRQVRLIGAAVLAPSTRAPDFQSSGTTFTASGCSNGTLVGGATAGKFTSGDSGGSCSITVTMGSSATAATGWACHAQDLTTPARIWGQTASTATSATFLSPATTTSSDVVTFYCIGY